MSLHEAQNAWSDKFARPTAQQLIDLHTPEMQKVLLGARKAIGGIAGVQESLDWQGVPWRWTFVFRGTGDLAEHAMPGQAAGPGAAPIPSPSGLNLLRAFAYVIPDPSRLQVCIPLTLAQIEAMPVKKMKRPIRDGIAYARSVAGVWWPTWDVASAAALEDVIELAQRKQKFLLSQAAVQA